MISAIWRPIQRGIGFGQTIPPRRSLIGFIKKFLNDWSLVFGSLIAYTFIVALLPLIITAFGILGLIIQNNPETRQTIVDAIVDASPNNDTKGGVREVTDMAIDNLQSGAGGILAIGLVFSLWGGSRLFVAIDQVFTIIYRTIERSFIIQNLISIGMLILFIFFMILIFVIGGVPSFVISALPNKNGAQFGIFIAGIAVTIFVAFIFFMLIYKLMPNKRTRSKDMWCGSLVAAILLDIFIILFPLYIRRFMGSFIGLIGFAVILITFFYYFSLILILGAQINAYFFERTQPLPEGLGTFSSQAFDRFMKRSMTPAVRYHPYHRSITPVVQYHPYHRPRPRPPPYY